MLPVPSPAPFVYHVLGKGRRRGCLSDDCHRKPAIGAETRQAHDVGGGDRDCPTQGRKLVTINNKTPQGLVLTADHTGSCQKLDCQNTPAMGQIALPGIIGSLRDACDSPAWQCSCAKPTRSHSWVKCPFLSICLPTPISPLFVPAQILPRIFKVVGPRAQRKTGILDPDKRSGKIPQVPAA